MKTSDAKLRAVAKYRKKLISMHIAFNSEKTIDTIMLERFKTLSRRYGGNKTALFYLIEQNRQVEETD